MQHLNAQPFSTLRNFFWPIHGYEHKKLVPMLALFFLISFAYNLLRCMKVTLVVTAPGSGAEVIAYLKVWAVLPGAVLLTYLYTWLSNRLSREHVFYAMISFFIGFFTLFLLVLNPYRAALEPTQLVHFLDTLLPEGLRGFVSIIRHWPFTLFYVLADLWSAIVLSMLFWGFANEVTSVDEAKRFYAIFALGANFSGIFSGECAQLMTLQEYHPSLPFGEAAWEQSLFIQLAVVLLIALLIVIIFRWMNTKILNVRHEAPVGSPLPAKEKLSLRECVSHLCQSPYLIYITILVVSYNIVYNLVDLFLTHQIHYHYPNASDFNAYMNRIASFTGLFATLFGIVLSGNVIRRYGWLATAMLTPAIWMVTSIGFFSCMLFSENTIFAELTYAIFHLPVHMLALMFGSAQICLGRAAKYTLFDETKEIAFIPLSRESQRKGKAVVDGIASRFGKSGGSFLVQVLLITCGELTAIVPFGAAIFLVAMLLWLYAVRGIGRMVAPVIDQTRHSTPASPEQPDFAKVSVG